MLCEIKLPALYRLFILTSSEDRGLPMAASLSAALQNLKTGPHPKTREEINCVCLAVYPGFVSKGRPWSPCRLHCCDCSRLFLLGEFLPYTICIFPLLLLELSSMSPCAEQVFFFLFFIGGVCEEFGGALSE